MKRLMNTVLPQARNKRSTEALRHLGWGLLGAAAAAYLRHRVRICNMLSPCCSGPGMACQECQECFAMASAQLSVHRVCATCLFLQVVKVTLVARGRREDTFVTKFVVLEIRIWPRNNYICTLDCKKSICECKLQRTNQSRHRHLFAM
jgi:hypothetical protein